MTDNKSSVERCYLHLWWFYLFICIHSMDSILIFVLIPSVFFQLLSLDKIAIWRKILNLFSSKHFLTCVLFTWCINIRQGIVKERFYLRGFLSFFSPLCHNSLAPLSTPISLALKQKCYGNTWCNRKSCVHMTRVKKVCPKASPKNLTLFNHFYCVFSMS